MWRVIRYKAAAVGIHLLFSLSAFAIAMAVIVYWWYPGALFNIGGGWQGMRIMALVDLVLGPLLTAVVIYPGKPKRALQFDIAVIAIFQMSALLWGVHAIHSQRPVAIAWHDGMFQTTVAEDYVEQQDGLLTINGFEARLPIRVFTAEPSNAEEAAGVGAFKLTAGLEPWQLAFLYRPLHLHLDDLKDGRIRDQLLPPEASREFDWYRVRSRYGDAAVRLDDNGRIIEWLVLEEF